MSEPTKSDNNTKFPDMVGEHFKKFTKTGGGKIQTVAGSLIIDTILGALKDVDPQRLSNIFPRFYDEVSKINNTLSSIGSPGNSSGAPGNDGGGQTPTKGVKEIITDSLTGALNILVKQYGYSVVVTSFTLPLFNNFDDLLEDYKEIVKNALLSLYISALLYGEDDIPTSIIPEIIFGDAIPPNVVSEVPDLYSQVYYTKDEDPYPGYVEFEGPEGETVYTIRTTDYLPFDSLEQEVYFNSEIGLATELSPYIVSLTLTVPILNDLLEKFCNEIADTSEEKGVGKNSKNQSDLVSMLGPILGGAINSAKTSHIPNSFLDQTKMNKLLNATIKEQNVLKNVIEKHANLALKLDSKSKSMSINLNFTNFSIPEIANQFLTHLNRMPGNTNISLPEIDKNILISKIDELDDIFNDSNIIQLLNFIKKVT